MVNDTYQPGLDTSSTSPFKQRNSLVASQEESISLLAIASQQESISLLATSSQQESISLLATASQQESINLLANASQQDSISLLASQEASGSRKKKVSSNLSFSDNLDNIYDYE